MSEQYLNSELLVNMVPDFSSGNRIHIQSQISETIDFVSNRDLAVSQYVRHLLLEMQRTKKPFSTFKEAAQSVGMGVSFPSQVLTGTGVGGRNAPRFAKMFGMSYSQLVDTAEKWAKTHGIEVEARQKKDTPRTRGAASARDLGVLQSVIDAVDQSKGESYDLDPKNDEQFWALEYLQAQKMHRLSSDAEKLQLEAERKQQKKIRRVKRELADRDEKPASVRTAPPRRRRKTG